MLTKEYRIVMPVTVAEYRTAQLYSTIQSSKNESGGGEGIEVVENRPFDNVPLLHGKFNSGQYTYKIYHLESKAPALLRLIMPKGSLKLHEESWNAFPYCKTVLTNPGYMKEKFLLVIESMHIEGNTDEANALELSPEQLQQRELVFIDISAPIAPNDYKESEDPTKFRSVKAERGPLMPYTWQQNSKELMTCYKLVIIDCQWLGLQRRLEKLIHSCELRVFTVFHRQIFCWMDEWYGLTETELRNIDEQAKEQINNALKSGGVRGLMGGGKEPD